MEKKLSGFDWCTPVKTDYFVKKCTLGHLAIVIILPAYKRKILEALVLQLKSNTINCRFFFPDAYTVVVVFL